MVTLLRGVGFVILPSPKTCSLRLFKDAMVTADIKLARKGGGYCSMTVSTMKLPSTYTIQTNPLIFQE